MKLPSLKYSILVVLLLGFSFLDAQEKPADFLKAEFHKSRRDAVRDKMPPNSVAVFFTNPIRNRANDVDYVYHQDPDLYYLTGYKEPHAVLLIFKDAQPSAEGEDYNEIIFVQPRDPFAEMWTGRRLGDEGVKEKLEILTAFNNTSFKEFNFDFSSFDKVLFYDFKNDVRDNARDEGDLFSLISQFKTKIGYQSRGNTLNAEPKKNNLDVRTLHGIMGGLREIKTPEEIDLLRKAVFISTVGQVEVMKAMKPGMSETEIQGIHEFVFKKYQTEFEGYPSIVGAGNNGCILHYIENEKPQIDSEEMVLMDLGAEYRGYTADITRTIPVDGKFSKEEKAIYDLAYKAQEAAMAKVKPGIPMGQLTTIARGIVNEGLVELGIIESVDTKHSYFPHGVSHHIGLDVHDKNIRSPLAENMVFVIEPGIYIPEGSDCDEKWWGIAVRIEDDFLVTKDGYELLSGYAPRSSDGIEAMMKQPSPLDAFQVPELKGGN